MIINSSSILNEGSGIVSFYNIKNRENETLDDWIIEENFMATSIGTLKVTENKNLQIEGEMFCIDL